MITLITGAPGAGKTAALVDLLRDVVGKGRAIFVDGIPDLVLPHQLMQDPRQWMAEVPDGAAVVIDEVQRVWRPAAPGARVAPDIEALETHRHRGLDFFLVTQHPNLLHANVRRLVGRHVHLRDVGILGRWWYEWPEVTDPGQFRNAPIKRSYKLPKAAFRLYKSASLHVKPIRSIPRAVIFLGLAVVVALGLAVYAWRSISSKAAPGAAPGAISTPGLVAAPVTAPAPVQRAQGQALPVVYSVGAPVSQREPYAGFGVHLAGFWRGPDSAGESFTVSLHGETVGSVSGYALRKAGYTVRLVAPCVAVLTFGGRERVAGCDAPRPLPARGAGAGDMRERPKPGPAGEAGAA